MESVASSVNHRAGHKTTELSFGQPNVDPVDVASAVVTNNAVIAKLICQRHIKYRFYVSLT